MDEKSHNQLSAATAIAALAKRFWSIHPKEVQDLGLTREQFYEREMLALFATLVSIEPQTCNGPVESSDEYFKMLWKWFEERGAIDRYDYSDGKTADDFKHMLDEHEASLMADLLVDACQA